MPKGIKIHFRKKGLGETIVLLHPSPRSGKMPENFWNMLSKYFEVIIPDLPSYGFPKTIPQKVKTLNDVVHYLKAFFEALNLPNPSIYGTTTGAQLRIAYFLTYTNDVKTYIWIIPPTFRKKNINKFQKIILLI